MRILFVTSEYPSLNDSESITFFREYLRELRKYAEVVSVYLHFGEGKCHECDGFTDYVFKSRKVFDAFSPDAILLEKSASLRAEVNVLVNSFKPDVIHCNDSKAFLPFRFEKNVFYSAHLSLFSEENEFSFGKAFFHESKIERCALEYSPVVSVYSDFASKVVEKITGALANSIVLPFGFRFEKNISASSENSPESVRLLSSKNLMVAESAMVLTGKKRLRISFFGRFDNAQSGLNDFVLAVNMLGKPFCDSYSLDFYLYGKGKIPVYIDTGLFKVHTCAEGENFSSFYRKSDIVVFPSRYEPFGYTGLEAMAAGLLVLLPHGLGMDMFAEPGFNCLEIPHNPGGISKVLKDAVINYDEYKLVRDNAVRTSLKWSWRRCVLSHMYVYRQMIEGRLSQLSSAYRSEERKVLDSYRKSSDVEKLFVYEHEKKTLLKIFHQFCLPEKPFKGETDAGSFLEMMKVLERGNRRFLVLTGSFQPDAGFFSSNVEVFSVLNEGSNGITVRPECLPFDDGEFDSVIICGAWESVIDPCGALVEAQRVCRDEVIVLYNRKLPHSWQTFQIESDCDWEKLTGEQWTVSSERKIVLDKEDPYRVVTFVNRKSEGAEKVIIA